MPDQQAPRGAGLLFGLALIALSILIGASTSQMQVPPTYAKVGPQVFPYLAALALAGLGAVFVVKAILRASGRLLPEDKPTDWIAVASISAGFLFFIAALDWLGFVLAAAGLFLATAVGFGSRNFLRDGLAAFLLPVVVMLVFTKLLGLKLPPGVLAGLF